MRLPDELARRAAQPTARLRTATVSAPPSGGLVTLAISGGDAPAPYLATYSPSVGDVVQVLQQGSQLLVLGTTAT